MAPPFFVLTSDDNLLTFDILTDSRTHARTHTHLTEPPRALSAVNFAPIRTPTTTAANTNRPTDRPTERPTRFFLL
jgi:hypothetical protein